MKIIGINHFASKDLDLGASGNYKENCMLLGLTIEEMKAVKNTDLENAHQRFIHLEPMDENPQQDSNSNPYFAYLLRLQGLDANQNRKIVTPQHQGEHIVVYSRDNQCFHTAAFSATETVTPGVQRIEFHVYHDGVVKINDNIDMALPRKVANIYYFYHRDPKLALPVVEVCNLEMVMADKMSRVNKDVTVSIPPNGFIEFHDYSNDGVPGVDAKKTYQNNDGDIITEGSGKTMRYNNQNKKRFMVHFVTADVYNTTLNIDITYTATLRHYANPVLTAAIIGALVKINYGIISTGFAFSKGSCYPSGLHVNGESVDTHYATTIQRDVDFILALKKFGFKTFRIGNIYHPKSNDIYNHSSFNQIKTIFKRDSNCRKLKTNETAETANCAMVNGVFTKKKIINSLHSTHLHSEDVELIDGYKTL